MLWLENIYRFFSVLSFQDTIAPRVVQGRSPIRIAYGDGGSRCRQGPTALRFPLSTFLDSSMVEHSAVNRRVVGSSPTRGVNDIRCLREISCNEVAGCPRREQTDSLCHGDIDEVDVG